MFCLLKFFDLCLWESYLIEKRLFVTEITTVALRMSARWATSEPATHNGVLSALAAYHDLAPHSASTQHSLYENTYSHVHRKLDSAFRFAKKGGVLGGSLRSNDKFSVLKRAWLVRSIVLDQLRYFSKVWDCRETRGRLHLLYVRIFSCFVWECCSWTKRL